MKHTVGIVTIAFKDEVFTTGCLRSLAGLQGPETVKVYVVVPSGDEHSPRFDTEAVKPTVITLPENRGFAWANNTGAKQALADGCDRIVLLNNDTTVAKDFLPPLMQTLADPAVGLVSPKIYFYPGREFHHDQYTDGERGNVIWYGGGVIDWQNVFAYHWGVNEVDHGQFDAETDTDFASGCCVALTAETWKTVGPMDESFFLYLEDVDWSMQCRRKGLKIRFQPKSVVWHKNAGATGGPGSVVHRYYQTRNRIYFAERYAPWRVKAAVWKSSWPKLWHRHTPEGKAVRDAWLRRFGPQ